MHNKKITAAVSSFAAFSFQFSSLVRKKRKIFKSVIKPAIIGC